MLAEFRGCVARRLHEERVAECEIDSVVLCLEEACTNAILHSGSFEDIEVLLQIRGEQLLLKVRDRGRGFDVDQPELYRMPDPYCCEGRGLPLMAGLMDEFRLVCDRGLEVTMSKRIRRGC